MSLSYICGKKAKDKTFPSIIIYNWNCAAIYLRQRWASQDFLTQVKSKSFFEKSKSSRVKSSQVMSQKLASRSQNSSQVKSFFDLKHKSTKNQVKLDFFLISTSFHLSMGRSTYSPFIIYEK